MKLNGGLIIKINIKNMTLLMFTLLILITTVTVISAADNSTATVTDTVSTADSSTTEVTHDSVSINDNSQSSSTESSSSTHDTSIQSTMSQSSTTKSSSSDTTSSNIVKSTTNTDTSTKSDINVETQTTSNSTSIKEDTTTSTDINSSSNVKIDSENKNIENYVINDNKTIKTATTHVVTNVNLGDYFDLTNSSGSLTTLVNEGDTLDFQGTINLTGQSLTIDKAVNIISTTGDFNLTLDGNSLSIVNTGSYSNITGLNLYNTQLLIQNANHIILDNISVVLEDISLGSGVGVTSIRENSSYVSVKNSYFYSKDSGSTSTFVLAWANYCDIDNCTILAEGNVGNIFYLTTYNVDIPDGEVYNSYNNITNSFIGNPSGSTSISVPIVLTGKNNYIANNTIESSGTGLMEQLSYTDSLEGTIIENNIWTLNSSINAPTDTTFKNNTYGIISTSGEHVTIENNTMTGATISQDYTSFSGNNVNGAVTVSSNYNSLTENNINSKEAYSINLSGSNNNITNNYLISASSYGDSSVIDNGFDNIISNNEPVSLDYVITDENYYDYFNNDGTLKSEVIPDNTPVIIKGTINNKNFIFTDASFSISGEDALLLGSVIKITNTSKMSISNITIDNTGTSLTEAIIVESDSNTLTYNSIYYTGENSFTAIKTTGGKNTINYNNIQINTTSTAVGFDIQSDNNIFNSNTIDLSSDSQNDESILKGMVFTSSNSNSFYLNTIKVNGSAYAYGLIFDSCSGNDLDSTDIYANATYEVYAITNTNPRSTGNYIWYNNININAKNIAKGININAQSNETITMTVSYNSITATADKLRFIEINNAVGTLQLRQNYLYGNGSDIVGIDISDSRGITILYTRAYFNQTNTTGSIIGILSTDSEAIDIQSTANYMFNLTDGTAVKFVNTNSSEIYMILAYTGNTPSIILENSNEVLITKSNVTTTNYGITIDDSSNINITENRINETTDVDYAIRFKNVTNSNVTDNILITLKNSGDDAVELVNSSNNNIWANKPYAVNITIEDTELIINVENTITIILTDNEGELSSASGELEVIIGDYSTTVTITNGVGSFIYTPTTDNNIDINLTFTPTNSTSYKSAILNTQLTVITTAIYVNNYQELLEAFSSIEEETQDEEWTIILQKNNDITAYYVTETINWGDSNAVRNISIKGNDITIDGQGTYQFLNILSGYNLNIENLNVINCIGENGGVISNQGKLVLTNVNLTNNQATMYGGAIYNSGSYANLTIINSTLSRNNASLWGGSLYNNATTTTTTIINCVLSNNSAVTYGGAIYSRSALTITDSTFNDNTAFYGGAIYSMSSLEVENSVFDNNQATYNGGGAIYSSSDANITYSNFIENVALYGGAIYNYGAYTQMTIINSIFTENAANYGGAVYIGRNSEMTISNSNFTNNTADIGDALYNEAGEFNIVNSNFLNSMKGEPNIETTINSPIYDSTLSQTEEITVKIGTQEISTTPTDGSVSVEYLFTDTGDIHVTFIYPSYSESNNITVIATIIEKVYYVTSYTELLETIEKIKLLTNDEDYKIVLQENEDPTAYYITETITWGNTSGSKKITIEGNGQTINGQKLQFLKIASGYTLELSNITIINCSASNGAVAYNNGTLIVTNATMKNNNGTNYAVFYNYQGSAELTIINSFFENNTANYGGIIYNSYATATIINSTFKENVATSGAGVIYNSNGEVTIISSEFTGNVARNYYGGAIYNYGNSASMNITDSVFEDNSASTYGGAIYNYMASASLYIRNTTFINNSGSMGGAIYNTGIADISNTTFTENIATSSGGAIYNTRTMTLTDSTFINNMADSAYALSNGGTLDFENNVFMYSLLTDLNQETILTSPIYDYRIASTEEVTVTIGDDSFNVTSTSGNVIATYIFREKGEEIVKFTYPSYESNQFIINVTVEQFTYYVNNYSELLEAINQIKDGVVDSDYRIILQENDDPTAYYVTETINWAENTNGAKKLIIEGNGQTIYGQDQQFIQVSEGYTLELINITITNCKATSGSVVYNQGTLIITNSTIRDNTATSYAVIYNYGNSADLTVFNSTFEGNNANYGGSIYNSYGKATIINSSFIGNEATNSGGVIYNSNGEVTITNSIFSDNTVRNSYGGAIYNYGNSASMNITDSVFEDNSASTYGGAIYNYMASASLYIRNTTFINNSGSMGGAIYNTGIADISNTTFTENIATSSGGAIYNTRTMNITKSIFTDNTASTGNAISNTGTLDYNNNSFITNTSCFTDQEKTLTSPIYDSRLGSTEEVTITIGEESYTVTSTSGSVSTTFTFTNDGEYVVSFDYPSIDSTIQINVDVMKSIELKVESGSTMVGETFNLIAQIKINGENITGGYVIFKINGKTLKDADGNVIEVPVVNGVATYNYIVPETTSTTLIVSAVFSGYESVSPVRSENVTITIISKSANIELNTTGTLMPGQIVTFIAYITDANGNAVTSGKVVFKLNGVSLKDANGNVLYAYVDENGYATLNYTIPDNFSAKDYTLTAVFQGTGYERTEINDTITISKIDTSVSVDSSIIDTTTNTITITQGENLQLKATITDEAGNTVSGTTKVAVKINEKTVVQQYVTDGVIDLTIYTSSFKNPVYSIEIIAGENSQYNKSTYNGTLSVLEPNSLLIKETSNNGTLLVAKD